MSIRPEELFRCEALGPQHDRKAFSCGVTALDSYIHQHAGQDARKRVAVPFVLTPDGTTIAGYFTLSQFAVQLADLPHDIAQKLPRYPSVPATLLGRLAVSRDFQGQGVGRLLLVAALRRSLVASRQVASAVVVVDAKDENAHGFYRKYGFVELPTSLQRLVLSMLKIEMGFALGAETG